MLVLGFIALVSEMKETPSVLRTRKVAAVESEDSMLALFNIQLRSCPAMPWPSGRWPGLDPSGE